MFPSETEKEGCRIIDDPGKWWFELTSQKFWLFFGDCYWYWKFKPEASAEPVSLGPKNRRQNDPNISDRWSTLKYSYYGNGWLSSD